MIYTIELDNTYANQEFELALDGIQNTISVLLQTTDEGALLMSVFVNNEQLGEPFLCFANQPVIPYRYMIDILGGNFVFKTENDYYPNYENFGDTCTLYFLTKDELGYE